MMKTLIFFAIIILSAFGGVGGGLFAQITNIPDTNFEQALIDLGIDSDGIINGQVLTADIENVEVLDISSRGIEDLTGIEGFIAIEELDVMHNAILSLVLTENTQLKSLKASSLSLSHLDVSNNLLLEDLHIGLSTLPELLLSNNILLKELLFGDPDPPVSLYSIQQLDLSNNALLEKLSVYQVETLEYVNLKSGGNHLLTYVRIECLYEHGGEPCLPIPCVEVDDFEAAQSNLPPYNNWFNNFIFYSEDCLLSVPSLNKPVISVYPNPTTDELFIHNPNEGVVSVRLYNITGQLLLQNQFKHINNMLSLKGVISGTYFLMIETQEGQKEVKKIVKN